MPSGFISLDAELGWPASFGEHWDIVGVRYGHRTQWQLRVDIEALNGIEKTVTFTDPVSFRVQDEGEIVDYWVDREEEGAPVANVYTIESSRYVDEIQNGVTAGAIGPLTHYLIGGQNVCVEVIGRSPPELL